MYARRVLHLLCATIQFYKAQAECWRDTPCDGPAVASFPGSWDANILAPDSRAISPVRVLTANQSQTQEWPTRNPVAAEGNGSMVVFDWGYEVGGVVTIEYLSRGAGTLGIAFTESSDFIGYVSDESNGGTGTDGALYNAIEASDDGLPKQNTYTVPDDRARGGFRYLSLYVLTNATLELSVQNVSVELSFHPNWENMQAYGGYFHSSDENLNKIWYASAYTIQTNIMPTNTARVYPCLDYGWENNASLYTNGPGLAAGNKRDRAVWAGDFGMAIRSAAVALGDYGTLRRSLQLQYDSQLVTGELPWVPPPINIYGSDTYHMSTLLATHDYVLFSGDMDWLINHWAAFKQGMNFVTAKIDATGLMDVTGANNWGRTAISSGYTTDGNMLLYGCLTKGAIMARWVDDAIGASWTSLAENIRSAIVEHNWDNSTGAFWNTATDRSNHCEDGNSMALYYGAVDSDHAARISSFLQTMWTPIGAETGELPGSIVMYVEGFEIKGHLAVGQSQRALDLMQLSWGWNLNNPSGTQSTFAEGYKIDGSWRYRDDSYSKNGSYTAHALGWSTGPIDALQSYVVGLQPATPSGKSWTFEPQFAGLEFAEGGFTSPLGRFSAGWAKSHSQVELWVEVPANTTGSLKVPIMNGVAPRTYRLNSRNMEKLESRIVEIKGGRNELSIAYA